ncbi:MAG: hypothetical protein A07HR67_01728 [uncultured archaeon A07HR67]|nr:MAG: hypothetical protein A07HR67_01728 [uncultured archaeon A07HR67]
MTHLTIRLDGGGMTANEALTVEIRTLRLEVALSIAVSAGLDR